MIVLFPMLTSKSVSPNVLPGVCKTLEKFVLVYKMDEVLKTAGLVGAAMTAGKAAIAYGALARRNESQDLQEVGPSIGKTPEDMAREKEWHEERMSKSTLDRKMSASKDSRETAKAQIDVLKDLQSDFKVEVNFPQSNSLHIEPTWVLLSSHKGTQVLGIKVVPFPISPKTDTDIVRLMAADLGREGMDERLTSMSRTLIRSLFTIARKFRVPFIKGKVITEDPVDTILFAKTQHGKNTFLCLNYSDINSSRMALDAVGVSKLFHMGWTSFIVADDVNKRAVFCMNEFKGICSTVPYQFLYSSVSRDALKVFTDLDDVRTSASPFFRLSGGPKVSKVVGESVAYRKLDDYLNTL